MARRIHKCYVMLGALVVALVVAPVAATQVRWNGSLGHGYGNSVGIPMRVGQSFSVGMTAIDTSRRVRIESVRLHGASGGVVLLGALVGYAGVGAVLGFPPTTPTMPLRPAVGAVIPAHANSLLVVGLRATEPGVFRVLGIDVRYRERWHGVEVKRLTHTGMLVAGCAVAAGAKRAHCRLPSMNP
jgi:peptidoglycan/LPS O-acetylase OafA/YrhL